MTTDFATFVKDRFGGTLKHGKHTPNGAACFEEAFNAWRGNPWGDNQPDGRPSFVALNDAPWSSDEARTEAMLPLGVISLAWPSWTLERRQAWARLVAEGVIRRILPPVLRAVAERVPKQAPELVAAALRCETEGSESAAWSAWSAAWSAKWSAKSAEWAAWSAKSAARSAESAAWAAWSAESAARSAWSAEAAAWSARSDAPLQELCRIMLEADEATR